jgi:hypothetical protein
MHSRCWRRRDGSLRAQLIEFDVLHKLAVADRQPLLIFGVHIHDEDASVELSLDLRLQGSKQQTSIGFALFSHNRPAPIRCPLILPGTNNELKRSGPNSPNWTKTLE